MLYLIYVKINGRRIKATSVITANNSAANCGAIGIRIPSVQRLVGQIEIL